MPILLLFNNAQLLNRDWLLAIEFEEGVLRPNLVLIFGFHDVAALGLLSRQDSRVDLFDWLLGAAALPVGGLHLIHEFGHVHRDLVLEAVVARLQFDSGLLLLGDLNEHVLLLDD